MKWEVDEMASWWNGKSTKCLNNILLSWANGKFMKCLVDEMALRQKVKLTNGELIK